MTYKYIMNDAPTTTKENAMKKTYVIRATQPETRRFLKCAFNMIAEFQSLEPRHRKAAEALMLGDTVEISPETLDELKELFDWLGDLSTYDVPADSDEVFTTILEND